MDILPKNPDDKYSVFIKVREANYLPAKAELRMWIVNHMLTANIRAGDYDEISNDPKVESISWSSKLQLID